jgi:predicted ABC-type transport system involved in lysophospholipase L1 biosynthesis ATPase subunit
MVLSLLKRLNEGGMTIVYVTHDRGLAERAARCISIRDGQVENDRRLR